MIINFFKQLRKAIKWFCIGFKDKDFDYVFLIIILYHKFLSMEKYFEKYGISKNKKKQIRKLKQARFLCQRIGNIGYNYIPDKFFDEIEFDNCLWIPKDEDKWQNLIKEIEKSDKLQKQDTKYLFELMSKHLDTWWD